MVRKCNCCGETLFGRSDKRFCNDACRSQHYHHIHQKERREITEINRILRKNRRILLEWRSTNESSGYKESLLKKGFCFDHYTHSKEIGKGRAFYCYDLGYVEVTRGKYRLLSD